MQTSGAKKLQGGDARRPSYTAVPPLDVGRVFASALFPLVGSGGSR